MIVVDLGCFPHRDEISIEPLVAQYRPDVLYGFDPWPALVEGETYLGATRVVLERKAAWVSDGELEFARVRGFRGWDSTVMKEKNSRGEWDGAADVIRVPCFDFPAWLRRLPEPPVVKVDVEGAEFPILERLAEVGADALVEHLFVEWHDAKMGGLAERKAAILARLTCPVSLWEDPRTTIFSSLRGLAKGRRAVGAR